LDAALFRKEHREAGDCSEVGPAYEQ